MSTNNDFLEVQLLGNEEQIAKMIRRLLTGTVVFVSANQIRAFLPEVVTGLQLVNIEVKPGKLTLHLKDLGEGKTSLLIEYEEFARELDNPVFQFRDGQVTIVHRALAGNLLYWVFAVQPF